VVQQIETHIIERKMIPYQEIYSRVLVQEVKSVGGKTRTFAGNLIWSGESTFNYGLEKGLCYKDQKQT